MLNRIVAGGSIGGMCYRCSSVDIGTGWQLDTEDNLDAMVTNRKTTASSEQGHGNGNGNDNDTADEEE